MKKKITIGVIVLLTIGLIIGLTNTILFTKEKTYIKNMINSYTKDLSTTKFSDYDTVVKKYWHDSEDKKLVLSENTDVDGKISNYNYDLNVKSINQTGINKATIVCDYSMNAELEGYTGVACLNNIYGAEELAIRILKDDVNDLSNKMADNNSNVELPKQTITINVVKNSNNWYIDSIENDISDESYDYDLIIK